MNGYLYETHLHTTEGSLCASSSARDQVKRYKDLGYSGIIITDHFLGGNTAIDRNQGWTAIVDQYCRGFENAKKEGARVGLDIWFGIENGFTGTEFLLYGIDRQWLIEHPEMRTWTIQDQFKAIDSHGGLVVHAHPMREAAYIRTIRLYPDQVHAVEVWNMGNLERDPLFNDRALVYAKQYKLPITGGSDAHHVEDLHAGMLFERKLTSILDFISTVKSGKGYTVIDHPL